MASPQVEDGHIDIANTIADKLCSYRLSGQEWQIIWVVLRKTWGWLKDPSDPKSVKKKMDEIALSQFVKSTGIDKRKCHAIIKKLVEKRVLRKGVPQKGTSRVASYGFQKNFDLWKATTKKKVGGSPKKAPIRSPKKAPIRSPKKAPTKEILKEKKRNVANENLRLSQRLLDLIVLRRQEFKNPRMHSWANHVEKMIRIDKRSKEEIERVIDWCQGDPFWQNNILSTKKLRGQFDRLALEMGKKKQRRGKSAKTTENINTWLEEQEDARQEII